MRDTDEGAVVDVTAYLPLGDEGDLIPGGAFPAELVDDRLDFGQEGGGRDGVSVLDGTAFAEEDILGVEVGSREGVSGGFAGVNIVCFYQQAMEREAFSHALRRGAVFFPVHGEASGFPGIVRVAQEIPAS